MKGFFSGANRATVTAHLCFLVAIVMPFLLFGNELETWIQQLIAGERDLEVAVLAISFLTLDVFLPVPSSFVNAAAVFYLGPMPGFLTCFVGLTIGCWLGYAFGHFCRKTLFDRFYQDQTFRKLTFDLSRYGFITLVAVRGMPVLAELSVMAAGYHRYPLDRFFGATTVSNGLLAAIYASIVTEAAALGSMPFFALTFVAVPVLSLAARFAWLKVVGHAELVTPQA